jgi:hypothetical protein
MMSKTRELEALNRTTISKPQKRASITAFQSKMLKKIQPIPIALDIASTPRTR